jgi:hypothetical protein
MRSLLSVLFALCLFVTLFTVHASPMHGSAGTHTLSKRGRSGKATYFHVGLGACGKRNKDSDVILALSHKVWSKGKHCGKAVTIKNTKTGHTVKGVVADMCPSCKEGDLDLSPAAFKKIGKLNDGVLKVSWALD